LQDVFWQVYRLLNTYDASRGAFTTWLHRITVNYCLNRRRRRPQPAGIYDEELRFSVPSHEHLVEIDDSLRSMLQGLSEKHRVVVVLRYVWDLTYEEIAHILEIPVGTVQSRLHIALKAVRQRLTNSNALQRPEGGAQ
jgi:RNA polymerase sigma-70 factor (ECF subfamily)